MGRKKKAEKRRIPLNIERLEDRAMLATLPAAETIVLNFHGASGVTYDGPAKIEDIDVPAFSAASAGLSGQERRVIRSTLSLLNRQFADTGVRFAAARPRAQHSTIFVGGAGEGFSSQEVWGVAETADVGNGRRTDKAFVFSDRISGGALSVAAFARRLSHVIAHEAGHLVGTIDAHATSHGAHPLDSVAFKPYTHVEIGKDVLADVLGDGKVTLAGQDYAVHPAVVRALNQYPQFYNAGMIGPDAFPDIVLGQSLIHGESTGRWLRQLYEKAWEAQNSPKYSAAEKSQILAFTYGFMTHAAGDAWAHTFVNDFAGGEFPPFTQLLALNPDKLSIAARHLLVEGIIADATPGYDNNPDRVEITPGGDISDDSTPGIPMDAPIAFIYDALVDPFTNFDFAHPPRSRGLVIDNVMKFRTTLEGLVGATNQSVQEAMNALTAAQQSLDNFRSALTTAQNNLAAAGDHFRDMDAKWERVNETCWAFPPRPIDCTAALLVMNGSAVYGAAEFVWTTARDAFNAAQALFNAAVDSVNAAIEVVSNSVDILVNAYVRDMIKNIDSALKNWGELGLVIARGLFDPQTRRDVQNADCAEKGDEQHPERIKCENEMFAVLATLKSQGARDFITNRLLPMAGAVTTLIEPLKNLNALVGGAINTLFGPILAAANAAFEYAGNLVDFPNPFAVSLEDIRKWAENFIRQQIKDRYGLDFEAIEKYLDEHSEVYPLDLVGNLDPSAIGLGGLIQGPLLLFEAGDHARFEGYLALPEDHHISVVVQGETKNGRLKDDVLFDKAKFAAYANSVTMSKMLLLDGAGVNNVVGDLIHKPYSYYTDNVSANPDVTPEGNIMLTSFNPDVKQWLPAIDADHTWRQDSKPQPTRPPTLPPGGVAGVDGVYTTGTRFGAGGFPLWEDCRLREPAFRVLFTDWENGAQNFPDLGDFTDGDMLGSAPAVANSSATLVVLESDVAAAQTDPAKRKFRWTSSDTVLGNVTLNGTTAPPTNWRLVDNTFAGGGKRLFFQASAGGTLIAADVLIGPFQQAVVDVIKDGRRVRYLLTMCGLAAVADVGAGNGGGGGGGGGAVRLASVADTLEGSEATLRGVVNPGVIGDRTLKIDWGDGAVAQVEVPAASRTFQATHRYADDGPVADTAATFTYEISVSDGSGADPATTNAIVKNAPPTDLGIEDVEPVDAGETTWISGVFFDPGDLDAHQVTIDWGDGNVQTRPLPPGQHLFTFTHVYVPVFTLEEDPIFVYPVLITVTDDDGSSTSIDTIAVVFPPPSPVLVVTPGRPTSEGETAEFNVAVIVPGLPVAHVVYIDWGDGTFDEYPLALGETTFVATHVYANDGDPRDGESTFEYAILAQLDDGFTALEYDVDIYTVINDEPHDLTLAAEEANEGQAATLEIVFADAGALDEHVVTVDWGDGGQAEEIELTGGERSLTVPHTYADDGTYDAIVRVDDGEDPEASETAQIVVRNVAPRNLVLGPVAAIVENQEATLDISFDDPGVLDRHTLTIDWGDGTVDTILLNEEARTHTAAHVYLDEPEEITTPFTISVRVADDNGDEATATTTPIVTNAPPANLTLEVEGSLTEGDSEILTLRFTDEGTRDAHTAIVDWGDGTTLMYPIAAGTTHLTVMHVYEDDGPVEDTAATFEYTIGVSLSDDDGDATSATVVTQVANAPPEPYIYFNPAAVIVGEEFKLAAVVDEPGTSDVLTIAWTILKNGEPFATGDALEIFFTPDEPGIYQGTITVTDDDGASASHTRTFPAHAASAPLPLATDLSGDGRVNLVDLVLLQRSLDSSGDSASTADPTVPVPIRRGDLNLDGRVDRADVAILLRSFGGEISGTAVSPNSPAALVATARRRETFVTARSRRAAESARRPDAPTDAFFQTLATPDVSRRTARRAWTRVSTTG